MVTQKLDEVSSPHRPTNPAPTSPQTPRPEDRRASHPSRNVTVGLVSHSDRTHETNQPTPPTSPPTTPPENPENPIRGHAADHVSLSSLIQLVKEQKAKPSKSQTHRRRRRGRRSLKADTSPCQGRSEPPADQPHPRGRHPAKKRSRLFKVQNSGRSARPVTQATDPPRRSPSEPPTPIPPAPRRRSAAVDGAGYRTSLPPCQHANSKNFHMASGGDAGPRCKARLTEPCGAHPGVRRLVRRRPARAAPLRARLIPCRMRPARLDRGPCHTHAPIRAWKGPVLRRPCAAGVFLAAAELALALTSPRSERQGSSRLRTDEEGWSGRKAE